jgi:hypothetical protein
MAADLESTLKDEPGALNSVAWTIAEGKGLKNPDYKLAVRLAQVAVDKTKGEDPMILDTLAYAQFKSGDTKKAIATQEKAVALLAKGDYPDDLKKEMRDRLAEFKTKK